MFICYNAKPFLHNTVKNKVALHIILFRLFVGLFMNVLWLSELNLLQHKTLSVVLKLDVDLCDKICSHIHVLHSYLH